MLNVSQLNAGYADSQVLWNLNLHVGVGEIVAMIGPNGAGKSTILNAIAGLVRPSSGSISFEKTDLLAIRPEDRVANGIALVLERRRLFPTMTVHDNLLMGAYHPAVRRHKQEALKWVESLFPILVERKDQVAGRMSGGEQQMVAIARALMSKPRLLLMDEPFLGLSPIMVGEVVRIIRRMKEEGVTVLFNEQNVTASFGVADRGYLIESGRIIAEGTGVEMLRDARVREVYLGESVGR